MMFLKHNTVHTDVFSSLERKNKNRLCVFKTFEINVTGFSWRRSRKISRIPRVPLTNLEHPVQRDTARGNYGGWVGGRRGLWVVYIVLLYVYIVAFGEQKETAENEITH